MRSTWYTPISILYRAQRSGTLHRVITLVIFLFVCINLKNSYLKSLFKKYVINTFEKIPISIWCITFYPFIFWTIFKFSSSSTVFCSVNSSKCSKKSKNIASLICIRTVITIIKYFFYEACQFTTISKKSLVSIFFPHLD